MFSYPPCHIPNPFLTPPPPPAKKSPTSGFRAAGSENTHSCSFPKQRAKQRKNTPPYTHTHPHKHARLCVSYNAAVCYTTHTPTSAFARPFGLPPSGSTPSNLTGCAAQVVDKLANHFTFPAHPHIPLPLPRLPQHTHPYSTERPSDNRAQHPPPRRFSVGAFHPPPPFFAMSDTKTKK